jgi:RecA-family ATPase
MVRMPNRKDQSTYDADYAAVKELRKLANEAGIAIVLVHHPRKADADNAFDTPRSKPALVAVPGDGALDPQTARTAKRFCRLADVMRL